MTLLALAVGARFAGLGAEIEAGMLAAGEDGIARTPKTEVNSTSQMTGLR